MPAQTSHARRRLAAAAVATVGIGLSGTGLAGCTQDNSDGPGGTARPGTRHVVPRGPQDVRAPGAGDRVRPGTPVAPAALHTPAGTPARPNILLVTIDDAASGDMRFMPHLQRLVADRGVTLTNGLAPTPMCVPARASLITGQYAGNHGAVTIHGEGGGFAAFAGDDNTLPVWLQDAGYDTMFTGKYLNGYGTDGSSTYVPPGWTDWKGFVDPSTYNFVAPTVNDNGTERDYREYSSDVVTDLTTQLLADPRRERRPWFCWANYVAPHVGGPHAADDPSNVYPDDPEPLPTTTPAPRDQNRFARLDLPDKPSIFEQDTTDKAIIRATHRTWSAERRAELREVYQQRIEALQSVDRGLARTLRTLRATGQLDDTYVVVTSDNGYVTGEHNLEGKLWYFQEIVGVPMYIRGPGLPRGTTSAAPVSNADWAPTFAALAGATPGRAEDGVDVLPHLTTRADRRVVPVAAYPVHGGHEALYSGVVVGPWTYVRSRGGRVEMYYRTVDPFQNSNLARDPRYRSQRKALRKLADRYADCAGAQCSSDFYAGRRGPGR